MTLAGAQAVSAVAAALVDARLQGRALDSFPGTLPATLEEAYALQKAAIAQWPDALAGWKVGRLSPDLAELYGVERFIGPIFAAAVLEAPEDGLAPFAMFPGGSAAFEAEFVVFAGAGPSGLVGPERLTLGVEVASSPITALPVLGTLATIADLGNNAGQIIGAPVPLAFLDNPAALVCETQIGADVPVSRTAETLPGGPAAAFAFALAQADRLGMPLRPGQFVSTGAVTGMHAVTPGLICSASFGQFGRIDCQIVTRAPG